MPPTWAAAYRDLQRKYKVLLRARPDYAQQLFYDLLQLLDNYSGW